MYRSFEKAGYIKEGKIKRRVEWVSVNNGNVGYGGGLKINTSCETNLEGLYAAGDAACGPASGVEGFCAYAIPFATTSGARSGTAASQYTKHVACPPIDKKELEGLRERLSRPLKVADGVDPDDVVLKVQEVLFPMGTYLIRHQERMQEALDYIVQLRHEAVPYLKAYDPHDLRMAIEASNMATCGELFLRAAITRQESRGSHLREDHPEIDNIDWLKWIILSEENGKILVSTENIPLDHYPMAPERKRYPHPLAKFIFQKGK